tara:strand:- start:1978 stop:2166 length:189 start_codon:yes stop_codon:yes gene_type:complete
MATTKLERAVDNYVDNMSYEELREFVFSQLLEDIDIGWQCKTFSYLGINSKKEFIEKWGNNE